LAILASSCASPKKRIVAPPTTSEYMSLRNLDQKLDAVSRRWQGQGSVIIGKLDIPENVTVASRTRLFPDGSFAAAVAPNRELIFYAHGYEPIRASVYDTGTLRFITPEKRDLRSLTVSVSLSSPAGSNTTATIQLVLQNTACLQRDFGHAGGNLEYVADTKVVCDGQTVEFDRLSRIPYRLVFTAPGYIKQTVYIDPKDDGLIDLGDITLIKATTFEFTYRTRVRKYGNEWVTDSQPRKSTIVCDGISQLRFSDIRTGLGGKLDMRLLPHNNEVYASFYYTGAAFYTLGSSKISDIGDFDSITVDENIEADNGVKIENGGLYYFRVKDFQDTDIEMVFQSEQILHKTKSDENSEQPLSPR
jgi:hypothetical protein